MAQLSLGFGNSPSTQCTLNLFTLSGSRSSSCARSCTRLTLPSKSTCAMTLHCESTQKWYSSCPHRLGKEAASSSTIFGVEHSELERAAQRAAAAAAVTRSPTYTQTSASATDCLYSSQHTAPASISVGSPQTCDRVEPGPLDLYISRPSSIKARPTHAGRMYS
eukprot:5499180-Pleurochrysis_carterae.AAC.3